MQSYIHASMPFLALAAVCLSSTLATGQAIPRLPQDDRPLAERFAVPPASCRILKIVHVLPDETQAQDALLRRLHEEGFGGMVTNVPFDGYLENEAKWQVFVNTVNKAHEAGMAMWLYDEKGYPSGTAGGITMRDHPEWEARGLYYMQTTTDGDAVTLDMPPGKPIQVTAFPNANGMIDLEHGVDLANEVRENKLSWQPPAGSWHVMAITEDRLFDATHASKSFSEHIPYINLLDAEPTARFLEVTHDAYAKRLGNDLGRYFVATFTDEPSLMSLFMEKRPWTVVPWSAQFAGAFNKRRGYDIMPLLPALAAEAGPKGKRARYDFWLTVSELVSENFFGQIQDRCRKYKTLSGGHLLSEEALLTHVPFYGDFFRCARRLDAPSIDCLTSIPGDVPWYIARLLSSVADLEGHAVTMSETSDFAQHYRAEGDTRPPHYATEDEIRGTCNREILCGITTITSYYPFKGLTAEQLNRINEWVGRCCTMLRGGHQVADIAVLYPVESIWPRFTPSHLWTEDMSEAAKEINAAYIAARNSLFESQRDFTFIDSKALIDGVVTDGVLQVGSMKWSVIVLPCVDTLPLAAWQRLTEFWRSGGVIIALGALPENSETEFPSTQAQVLAKEIFPERDIEKTRPNAAGGMGVFVSLEQKDRLNQVLDTLLQRDVTIEPKDAPIHYTHRRIDEHDVYFVINDSDQPWQGTLTFAALGSGEQYDPATGSITPIAETTVRDLRLSPYGAVLYRFVSTVPSRRLTGTGTKSQ